MTATPPPVSSAPPPDAPPPAGRSRSQFLLIFGIALGSLFGAWLLYALIPGAELLGTTNRGEFVEPHITVAELALTRAAPGEQASAAGEPFATEGVWWLWVVPDGACGASRGAAGADCEETLYQLHQLHELLNRDAERVSRALVSAPETSVDHAALTARFPRLVELSGNLASLEPGVYVVDPIGNLVLRYPLTGSAEAVLDDLKRLLKVSQIG
jgi:hypothetical protein